MTDIFRKSGFPLAVAVLLIVLLPGLRISADAGDWDKPADPIKIVGPIYFVGTEGLCSWLITTPQGHILLNTGLLGSGPMIEASIRKLGFKPQDIKILLASHAHLDHVGGLAYLKKISGAKMEMMDRDVPVLESGGKADFLYGNKKDMSFPPVKVDRSLHDGDTIQLGNITLTARLTPGHTKGSTTFVTTITDNGKSYSVVFPDGTGINPGYQFVKDPSYPGIAGDYRHTFEVLASLNPDIWLAPHVEVFNFWAKRARAAAEGVQAWVDPQGYKEFVAAMHARFEAEFAKQTEVTPKSK
jgi:metallo-beta-lactamase class B